MRSVVKKVVGWTLFAVCFLGTIEIACRIEQWFLYDAPIFGLYTYDTALFTTDEYGITGKANGVYEKWRLNSLGFRGPEIRREKDPQQLRIVCVGASETFGLYESSEQEWPRQLEALLEIGGIDAEVVNAAIAGMSLSQRTTHLQKRLLPLHPDIVVMMLEYGSYAGMTEDKLKVRQGKLTGLPNRRDIVVGLKTLRIVGRFKDVFLPRLPDPLQRGFEQLERGAKLRMQEKAFGAKFRSVTHISPFEVELFKHDLSELSRISSGAGIRLVLLSPAMWFTERNLSMTYLSWPYLDESWWREAQSVLPATIREFSKEHNLSYVDLSEMVRGHESEWMMDMLHFNNNGAKKVAERIVEQLMKENRTIVRN